MAKGANTLRIISGQWRGRKLRFPDVEGLRPSPDRVRETLFAWLQGYIDGARCLDLFAGSGALGLEALSRGAAYTLFVDREARATAALREHLALLGGEGEVAQADTMKLLAGPPAQGFDIVFLDPPVRKGMLIPCCEALAAHGWLRPGARVYLEFERSLGEPELPEGWSWLRLKQAGQLAYGLAEAP